MPRHTTRTHLPRQRPSADRRMAVALCIQQHGGPWEGDCEPCHVYERITLPSNPASETNVARWMQHLATDDQDVPNLPPIAGGSGEEEPPRHDFRVTVRENFTEDREWIVSATDDADARARYSEGVDVDSRTIETHHTSVRSVAHVPTPDCPGCWGRPPIAGGSGEEALAPISKDPDCQPLLVHSADDILASMERILRNHRRWAKSAAYRNNANNACLQTDATKVCLSGALALCSYTGSPSRADVKDRLYHAIEAHTGRTDLTITAFNDSARTTHADILGVLRIAIRTKPIAGGSGEEEPELPPILTDPDIFDGLSYATEADRVLENMERILRNPRRWTQMSAYRTNGGDPCLQHEATKACLNGALAICSYQGGPARRQAQLRIYDAIEEHTGAVFANVTLFNDSESTTHDDILAILRRAIRTKPIAGGSIEASCIGRSRCIVAKQDEHCPAHFDEVPSPFVRGCHAAYCYCEDSNANTEFAYEEQIRMAIRTAPPSIEPAAAMDPTIHDLRCDQCASEWSIAPGEPMNCPRCITDAHTIMSEREFIPIAGGSGHPPQYEAGYTIGKKPGQPSGTTMRRLRTDYHYWQGFHDARRELAEENGVAIDPTSPGGWAIKPIGEGGYAMTPIAGGADTTTGHTEDCPTWDDQPCDCGDGDDRTPQLVVLPFVAPTDSSDEPLVSEPIEHDFIVETVDRIDASRVWSAGAASAAAIRNDTDYAVEWGDLHKEYGEDLVNREIVNVEHDSYCHACKEGAPAPNPAGEGPTTPEMLTPPPIAGGSDHDDHWHCTYTIGAQLHACGVKHGSEATAANHWPARAFRPHRVTKPQPQRCSEIPVPARLPSCGSHPPISGGAVRQQKLTWRGQGRGGSRMLRADKYTLFHPFTEEFEKHGTGPMNLSSHWRVTWGEKKYTHKHGWVGEEETLGTFTGLAEAKDCAQRHADIAEILEDKEQQLELTPIAGGSGDVPTSPGCGWCCPGEPNNPPIDAIVFGAQALENAWVAVADVKHVLAEHAPADTKRTWYPRFQDMLDQIDALKGVPGWEGRPPIAGGSGEQEFTSFDELLRDRMASFLASLKATRASARQITVSEALTAGDEILKLFDSDDRQYASARAITEHCFAALVLAEKLEEQLDEARDTLIVLYRSHSEPDLLTPFDDLTPFDEHPTLTPEEAWIQCIEAWIDGDDPQAVPPKPPIAGGSGEEEPRRLTTRERKERRLYRREDWAESRARKRKAAEAEFDQRMKELPPFGEPIKVGHHSEGRHRRAIARTDRALAKIGEHATMAERHATKADTIHHQLETSIYDDDPDAIAQLQRRIQELEAQRERRKAINAWLTKHGGIKRRLVPRGASQQLVTRARDALERARAALDLSEDEMTDLGRMLDYSQSLGYPPYALSNLSANIRRQVKRLERLRKERGDA